MRALALLYHTFIAFMVYGVFDCSVFCVVSKFCVECGELDVCFRPRVSGF